MQICLFYREILTGNHPRLSRSTIICRQDAALHMELISLDESLKILQSRAGGLRRSRERVPTRSALHRVISAPAYAFRSQPSERTAAMDGIAIDFRDASPLPAKFPEGKWARINTGDAVPVQFNAVIKIERVKWENDLPVLENEVAFWENVRLAGEDFEEGSLLFAPGHRLRPQDLSLLLCAGRDEVEVYRKPVITFIPTGSELVEHPEKESNSAMIGSLVDSWGGDFALTDTIPDDPDGLAQILKLAAGHADILVVSAGTSMGTGDITSKVLDVIGKIHFHGVAVSPARPVLLGEIGNVPVIGLPGYPAAAYVASYLYLRPLVCALSGIEASLPRSVFISAEDLPAKEHDSFHRVNLYQVDGLTFVRRIPKGAGSIRSLSEMDGLMHVPTNTEIKKRDAVRIEVLQDHSLNTISVRGIPDLNVSHLFDLFRTSLPSHRLLFWDSPPQEALQSIVERNIHAAVIATSFSGPDLFPVFAKQLQEEMYRYRIFTRSVALLLRSDSIKVTRGLRVGLPKKNRPLWDQFLSAEKLTGFDFSTVMIPNDESAITLALEAGHFDAVFADIRFLRHRQCMAGITQEHVDLVVSLSSLSNPAIGKLIELLLSDEYGKWLETRKGCNIRSRGLLQENI